MIRCVCVCVCLNPIYNYLLTKSLGTDDTMGTKSIDQHKISL